jgi:hypothetical protein
VTRITALLISADPSVYASAWGPLEGKWGVYIGTMDESPSGNMRPRHLLTSRAVYATAEEAQAEAERLLAEARAAVLTPPAIPV